MSELMQNIDNIAAATGLPLSYVAAGEAMAAAAETASEPIAPLLVNQAPILPIPKEELSGMVDVEQFRNSVFLRVRLNMPSWRLVIRDQSKLVEFYNLLGEEIRVKKEKGETIDYSKVSVPLGTAESIRAAKTAVSNSKCILSCPELDALESHLRTVKTRVVGKPQYGGLASQLPFFPGIFALDKGLVSIAKAIIAEGQRRLQEPFANEEGQDRPGYLTAFLAVYEGQIAHMQNAPLLEGGLGPLFNLADYDSTENLRSRYGIEKRLIAFAIPEGLPESDRAEALAELKKDLTDAADQMKDALRVCFQELIDHGRAMLTSKPGEKPKVIKASLIGNVIAFCDTFTLRNVDDQPLAELVAEAKKIMTGIDPEKMRKYASAREQGRAAFEALSAKYDQLITTQSGRFVDLSE